MRVYDIVHGRNAGASMPRQELFKSIMKWCFTQHEKTGAETDGFKDITVQYEHGMSAIIRPLSNQ